MATRSYGQYCGLARALELVGERWALLVVRELIPGPKRFTDLRRGLPRIPTNVLTARLKELEEARIVERRVLPRPAGSVVYDLTVYGRELEDVVLPMLRWGAKSLGAPQPDDASSPDAMVVGLRGIFRPEAARRLRARYELRVGDMVVHACVDRGRLGAGVGELPDADLTIESDLSLRAVLAGELSPQEAIDRGSLRLTGDRSLLQPFVAAFPMPVRS